MSMLLDKLKEFVMDNHGRHPGNDEIARSPLEIAKGDTPDNTMSPTNLMKLLQFNGTYPGVNYDDATGNPSADQSNPFKNMLKGAEQGTMRNFLNRIMGGGMEPAASTPPAAALDPTPLPEQKQPNLSQSPSNTGTPDLPQPNTTTIPKTSDYSQPSALDPQSIEELRQSLMTQEGQMDPANPNGLSGRMNSPLAESDMGQQRNQAMAIEDSIRGFDGVKPQKIKERTSNAQTR